MALAPDTNDDIPPKPPLGKRCREISGVAIQALLDLVDEVAVNGTVAQRDVHRIAQAILAAEGSLTAAYAHNEQKCTFAFHRAAIECQRNDILGRLVVEPFALLLDQPNCIERKRLGQFLLAVRMMIGEEDHETLRNQAAVLADSHRGSDGFVNWETFHADPAGDAILEHVLVSIAKSFRRFDPRRDWFLVVLNANPSAVSIGSTSFTPLKPEERAQFAFVEINMARVFEALFATVRQETFTGDRLRRFSKRWNGAPDKIFGQVFLEVARMKLNNG